MRLILFSILCLANPLAGFEKTLYNLQSDPIDIVIPCCEKDVEVLDLCIHGARRNIASARRIIVVSPKRYTESAEWYDEQGYPFSKEDVACALGIDPDHHRLGWYYQQLLKLYAPLAIPDISSNVLILDADTIFLRPVKFLDDENGGLYAYDKRIHTPYFEHMERLLPKFDRAFPQYSGICHHMLFQKEVIAALLSTIEEEHKIDAWIALCQLVDPQHLDHSGMAEYEIYFNFAFHTTEQMVLRPLKFANISKLSTIPYYKQKGYDYVSCHHYMRK